MSFDLPLDRMDWQAFRNDSGEVVPAFGIMEVTGLTIRDDDVVLTITKPSTTFGRPYVINGDSEVSIGGYGNCTNSSPCPQYYTTGTTPAIGDGYGPKPSQWTLEKNYPGTTKVIGLVDSTNKILYGSFDPITIVIGKLAGPLAQGNTATVNIWSGAGGSEAVISSMTLTVRDWLMKSGATDISSGKKVVCQLINGIWYATEAECE